ncbi:Protein of unknown function, DUF600 [Pseudomonas sp. NFIX10]|uniref:DUF600 family protein n=1 Tax=unclassified Pseudomonas TaxID=196821 RepID=UPI0008E7DB4A|nr:MULTISPECIES: DUF600 family protein [unclassified Pseudomonas]SFB37648.1 Protein of unknown function, DUF600 [Pseudomonas sp. NFIX10]SFF44540.1 Protein of unknown function, DUF600 [Pseudomonas sp. NFACC06-1]
MVTKDLEIVKEIFSLIDSGIVLGYDSFCYEVEVGEGYMESVLTVEKDGVEVTDADTDFNSSKLYRLIKELKAEGKARGEEWLSFSMSYRREGEVKTKFNY